MDRLSPLQIPEPDITEQLRRCGDFRKIAEQLQAFLNRHIEQIGDRIPLVGDLQNLGLESRPAAGGASHFQLRQKMHVHRHDPEPLARFTAPARCVEGEVLRGQLAALRFRQSGIPIKSMPAMLRFISL